MIPKVPEAWITACIKEQPDRDEWDRIRPKGSGPSLCEEHGISMSDVLALPADAKKVSDGYLIEHPIHGATGDGNLFVNTTKDLWCCYHAACDNSGGDPLTWVAVREGFINCEDAHGSLDKETFLQCKDLLRREGLIQESEPNAVKQEEVTSRPIQAPPGTVTNAWYDGEMSSVTIYVNGKPTPKKLPEIVPVVVVDGPKTIDELLDVFHEHLYFEEDYNVVGPVCAFLCNFTPQDPCIIGIVGPSGSIKTEMIRSFGEVQNQFCYPVSSLTENTLISGMDKNIDTIPLLRGRVLTIKDLTMILSKNEDIRSAIFADFREVNDGFIHKEFGNGVKKEYHNIHSTILFACTPAIERYYSMYANLGTRMLFLRPRNDPIKARKKSRENQKKGMPPIRKTLQDAILSFVDVCVTRLMREPLPEVPEEIEEEIGRYCDVLAWLRHPLHHDIKGYIDEIAPDPEFPTRLMNTICLLTQMHAFIYKRATVDREHDLELARRIVADNIPVNRAGILTYLTDEWQSTSVLSQDSGINPQSLYRPLDELTVLGLAKKVSREDAPLKGLDGRSSHYRLAPEWSQSIQVLYSVISLGGRVREKTIGNPQGGDTLQPDHTIQKSQPEGDQVELVQTIHNTLIALRNARTNNTTKINRSHLVNEVAAVIRVRYPQWSGRPIEDDIEHLNESDSQIQALLAELTDVGS